MRIGHTLLGGAVVGLIIASGVAICATNAAGKIEVTKSVKSQVTITAQASAKPFKTIKGKPGKGNCLVTVVGKSVGNYRVDRNTYRCAATAYTTGEKAYFVGLVQANALSSASSNGIRRVRVFPMHAQAVTSATGKSESWLLGYPAAAYGRSHGLGTTYHIGHADGLAVTTAKGTPSHRTGAYSSVLATAVAQSRGYYRFGGYGAIDAEVTAKADAIIRRKGIRYSEANGLGVVDATAIIGTVAIYQSQTGWVGAEATGVPVVIKGAMSEGHATAAGYGAAVGVSTAVAAIDGDSYTFATGKAKYFLNAISTGTGIATAYGNPNISQSRAYSLDSQMVATGFAKGVRVANAEGAATLVALTSSKETVRTLEPLLEAATATATVVHKRTQLSVRGSAALCTSSMVERGTVKRYASGSNIFKATLAAHTQIAVRLPVGVKATAAGTGTAIKYANTKTIMVNAVAGATTKGNKIEVRPLPIIGAANASGLEKVYVYVKGTAITASHLEQRSFISVYSITPAVAKSTTSKDPAIKSHFLPVTPTTATAKAHLSYSLLSVGAMPAIAKGVAQGQSKKDQYAESTAHATAVLNGRNQVNDFSRAPDRRTYNVEFIPRTAYIEEELRIISI